VKLLFFVQMLNKEDTIRGFIPGWLRALSREVGHLTVVSQETYDFDFPKNVTVFSLKKEQGLCKYRQFLRLQTFLARSFFSGQVDAILTHMTPIYTVLSAPLAKLTGRPLFTWYTHSHVSNMLKAADLFSTACFTASDQSYRLPSRKKKVLGHGIDLEHFSENKNLLLKRKGPLRLITASRLSPVKNLHVLLQALEDLPGEWTLDLAGEAPMASQKKYEHELRKLAAQNPQKITWHGAIPYTKMPAFLERGDVYVNLSDTGSIDKSVLEALSVGLTVLTGNEAFDDFLGGTRERTYFRPIDSKKLRLKIEKLLTSPREILQEDRDLLYEKVKEEHSLDCLAKNLVDNMKAFL
jgi:glycosyltransferase involved in cell wall biosynthesis